jgi:hypothetical protein
MRPPRHPRRRESDLVRAVMALVGFIILPILLVVMLVLATSALLAPFLDI